MARDGTAEIKTALVRKLRAGIQTSRIPGVDDSLISRVIQTRPVPSTVEPYIYIRSDDSLELDITKTSSSTEYYVNVEVVAKSNHNSQAQITLDAIVSEISRVLDTTTDDYINIENEGFCIYVQNIDDIARTETEELGATYFKATLGMTIRATFVGLPSTNQPVEAPEFTYDNFLLLPTANAIEEGDAGTITTSLTYPSGNFGWDFVSGTVIQPFGSDGALAGNVYTINTTDTQIQLGVTLNYQFIENTEITTTLQSTHQWNRQRSLRFGSIAAIGGTRPTLTNNVVSDTGVNLLSNWVGSNKTVQIGTLAPVGNQITVQGQDTEYIYIIFDATQDDLGSIEQDLFGTDITDRFEAVQTVGNYKVYLSTDPLNYTGDITLDLR